MKLPNFQSAFLGFAFLLLEMVSKVNSVEGGWGDRQSEKQVSGIIPDPKWRAIFSSCPVNCGGAYQKSKVYCMRGDVRIDEGECFALELTRPQESVQPCGMQPCIVTKWLLTDYSDCSVTCGNGTIYQVVKCFAVTRDANGKEVNTEVPERMCRLIESRPPSSTKNCTNPVSCPLAVSKVEQICVGSQCVGGGGETPTKNTGATVSALVTALLVCAASLTAWLRIYLFDT